MVGRTLAFSSGASAGAAPVKAMDTEDTGIHANAITELVAVSPTMFTN